MSLSKSQKYWGERFKQLEEASNKTGHETLMRIEPSFDEAQKRIQKEIEAWYGRYAKNNGVTMQEAKKQLTTRELKEFRWDVNEYIKYGKENALNQQWMKELENASARVHVSRLEALKLRTQQYAEKAFGNELDEIDSMARKLLTDDYYHACFEVQKGFNIGWELGQIDERKLDKYVSKPWAADGKNFSDRIWNSKSQLVDELHKQLTQSCILGKAPDDAIKAISKKFNTSKSQAGRLVMTEQAYFHSVAQQEAFNDLDVEEYEIVATLDDSTSKTCQEMDGKHFPMNEYKAGVTAPPFHVWCRSVTVPYFEDNFTGERAARNGDGKTYYVPDDMTYPEWKEYYVDGTKDPKDWERKYKPPKEEPPKQDEPKKTGIEPKKDKPLTEDEKEAIKYYVSGEGMWVNSYLRNPDGFGELYGGEVDFLKDLSSATDRTLPDDITKVYRSVDARAIFGELDWDDWDAIRDTYIYDMGNKRSERRAHAIIDRVKGHTITEKGFMSTTKEIDVAMRWGDFSGAEKPIVLEFDVPKGMKGIDLKDFDIEGDEQYEVLFHKGSQYNIKEITSKEGQLYIKCEFISDEVVEDVIEETIEEVIEEKEIVKLDVSNFPKSFQEKREIKNTQATVDFINGCEDADVNVLKLYQKMGEMENVESRGIPFKISHSKNHAVGIRKKLLTDEIVDVTLTIPKLEGENLMGQMNTVLHEEMHLMDFFMREDVKKDGKWFSSTREKLMNIFTTKNTDMNDEIANLFKQFKKEYDDTTKELSEMLRERRRAIALKYYPDGKISFRDMKTYKLYDKETKALSKWFETEFDYRARNLMGGGVGNLQDIYDALSHGEFRDKGTVLYGHGGKYYAYKSDRAHETIANYASLAITRPDLIELLRKDKPELVKELEETVKAMLEKVGG